MIDAKKYKAYVNEAIDAHINHGVHDLCYGCAKAINPEDETYSIVRKPQSGQAGRHDITFHSQCFLEIAGDEYMMTRF